MIYAMKATFDKEKLDCDALLTRYMELYLVQSGADETKRVLDEQLAAGTKYVEDVNYFKPECVENMGVETISSQDLKVERYVTSPKTPTSMTGNPGRTTGTIARSSGYEDSGAAVDYVWTGIIGHTADGLPHCGKIPDHDYHYILVGHNGGGMALIFLTAKGIAKMISQFEESGIPNFFKTTEERLEKDAFPA
ncbi:hypothetical protein BKA65DRAFT_482231 [Rhexocercosporidium sp. MPI-PUGE-AT-0058]|nr:hypothetical protein BKA65DRAFT_482231 [Rhexocercosporidium sp. MPI-PUGE-AT-0058]